MKKMMLSLLCLVSFGATSQVFSGSQEIEKGVNKDGLYVSTPVKEKFITPSWKAKLAEFGRVDEKKDTYNVTGANIPAISSDPITLQSRITNKSGRTTIFMVINVGNEEYITANHAKYGAAEKILNDFLEKIQLEENVRNAEKELADTQDKQSDVSKAGEKLVRKVESNKKDKDNLERKLAENKTDLEKLLTDIETNKKDQMKAAEEVDLKKKAVEAAKARVASGGKQ